MRETRLEVCLQKPWPSVEQRLLTHSQLLKDNYYSYTEDNGSSGLHLKCLPRIRIKSIPVVKCAYKVITWCTHPLFSKDQLHGRNQLREYHDKSRAKEWWKTREYGQESRRGGAPQWKQKASAKSPMCPLRILLLHLPMLQKERALIQSWNTIKCIKFHLQCLFSTFKSKQPSLWRLEER